MGQLVKLEINQDVTAQQTVVEHKIHEVMIAIKRESLLPGLKEKSLAEFEQKVLEMRDDGGLQIGFGVPGSFFQPQKFEDEGFFEEVFSSSNKLTFPRQPPDPILVSTERETLIQAGCLLTFQFTDVPA